MVQKVCIETGCMKTKRITYLTDVGNVRSSRENWRIVIDIFDMHTYADTRLKNKTKATMV